jgi:plastocyanin
MRLVRVVAALLVTGLMVGRHIDDSAAQSKAAPTIHVVHLVEYSYDPGDIVAAPGDTVRFVQDSPTPHNVEFRSAPPTAALGDARTGPYLVKQGDTYDLVIDQRFPAGVYQFACTPHQALGMKGTLTVR